MLTRNRALACAALLGACTRSPTEPEAAPASNQLPAQPAPGVSVDAEQAKAAAVDAARAWLALIDAGNNGESRSKAAKVMRTTVTAEQWDTAMKGLRAPLGAVVSRDVAAAEYRTQLPGAPDGHYVVIQFKTRFANKESAVETVTPSREEDGVWRASGYYLR